MLSRKWISRVWNHITYIHINEVKSAAHFQEINSASALLQLNLVRESCARWLFSIFASSLSLSHLTFLNLVFIGNDLCSTRFYYILSAKWHRLIVVAASNYNVLSFTGNEYDTSSRLTKRCKVWRADGRVKSREEECAHTRLWSLCENIWES